MGLKNASRMLPYLGIVLAVAAALALGSCLAGGKEAPLLPTKSTPTVYQKTSGLVHETATVITATATPCPCASEADKVP